MTSLAAIILDLNRNSQLIYFRRQYSLLATFIDTITLVTALFLPTSLRFTLFFFLINQCLFRDFTVDWAFVADSSDTAGRAQDTSLIFSQGILFHNNFFGTTDDTEHTVVEGRMGHLIVPRDFSTTTHSPYGFARAPWNINPSQYVTRYHSNCGVKGYGKGLDWPSCSNHFKMVHSPEYDNWDSYVWELSYGPHGPVHAWTGGVGGQCDTFAELDTLAELKGTSLAKALSTSLRSSAFNLLKFAWRELAIEMPATCSSDAPASECMWSCHGGADTVLETLLASSYLNKFPAEVWEDDIKDIVKKVMCETPFWPGEHLDAGSPLEASFWPVHPGLDRLTQYKALIQPFKDETWPNVNSTHTDVCSTLHYPHMHDGDSSSDPGADAVTAAPNCLGHHATDLTYWPSVSADATTGAYTKTYLTNGEVLSATSPSATYSAPYIYEHFEWSHCETHGITFKSVVG